MAGHLITPPPHAPPVFPAKFAGAAFDNFRADTAELRSALAAVAGWLERVRAGVAPRLALIGETGTGKSHLLYAAAHALVAEGWHVYSRPWYRLADELRYGGPSAYNTQRRMEPFEVREQLWSAPIVLIDEVRPTAGTAFDDTELAKFACHAYDEERAVLITSNVNPLSAVMGPPAASRFTQAVVVGRDYRQTRVAS